jgi:hypothetical protein
MYLNVPQRKQHTGARIASAKAYWHCSDVHTPAAVPEAESNRKSIKLPAAIVTEPVAEQLPFVAGEQTSAVSVNDPAAPDRNVTLIDPDCCEYTSSFVAVHPVGTHVSTDAVSVKLAFGVFTA